MKKIFLGIIFVLLSFTFAYGASDDLATKSDIQMLNARFDDVHKRIDDVITNTNKRIDDLRVEMNNGFEAVHQRLTGQKAELTGEMTGGFSGVYREIDNLESRINNRIEDLKTTVYWLFTLLALFLGAPMYGPAVIEFLSKIRVPKISVSDREIMREFIEQVKKTREVEKSK